MVATTGQPTRAHPDRIRLRWTDARGAHTRHVPDGRRAHPVSPPALVGGPERSAVVAAFPTCAEVLEVAAPRGAAYRLWRVTF